MYLVIPRYRVHGLQILPDLILRPGTIADDHDRVGGTRYIHAHAVVRPGEPLAPVADRIELPLAFPAQSRFSDRDERLPHVGRADMQFHVAGGKVLDHVAPPEIVQLRVRPGRTVPLVGRRVLRRILAVVLVRVVLLRATILVVVVVVGRVHPRVAGARGARRIHLDHVVIRSRRVPFRARAPRLRPEVSTRYYLPAGPRRRRDQRGRVRGRVRGRHGMHHPMRGVIRALYHERGREPSGTRRLRLLKVLELLHGELVELRPGLLSLLDVLRIAGLVALLYVVDAGPL